MEHNSGIEESGVRTRTPKNPISKCNLVLECYNVPFHQQNETELPELPNSLAYRYLFALLTIPYNLIFVTSLVVPYLNLLSGILVVYLDLKFEQAFYKYKQNKRLIPDPFSKMIYDPYVCQVYKRTNVFLDFDGNLPSISEFLESERNRVRNGRVYVMFYNKKFQDYYNGFPKYRWVHAFYMFLSGGVMFYCYYFLYSQLGFHPFNLT